MKTIAGVNGLLILTIIYAFGLNYDKDDGIEKAINLAYSSNPYCMNLPANDEPVVFPYETYADATSSMGMAVLEGLQNAELINIVQVDDADRTGHLSISLTDKGYNANVWDEQKQAFCLGSRKVTNIVSVKYLDETTPDKIAMVDYTWGLADTPEWFDKSAFMAVPGATHTIGTREYLVSTNGQWKSY